MEHVYNGKENTKYLKLLKQNYSSSQAVIREIVNLTAITNLPKGTEFFLSDIHGEYEAFLHIMNNCSGVIKEKVDLIFKDTLSEFDRGTVYADLLSERKNDAARGNEQN